MRYLLIILLLVGPFAFGQRGDSGNPFNTLSNFEQFRIEDSIDGLYTDDILLNVVTDTLPLYSGGDDDIWRKVKLVYFYIDSLHVLKKIAFRNGQEGYLYFYFENGNLKKARSINNTSRRHFVYYYTNSESNYSLSKIDEKIIEDPDRQNFYESLRLGKAFLVRFTELP